MVTKPNMPVPPAPTGLKTAPKIEPATVVGGATQIGSGVDVANRDRTGENNFKLPEKVSQQEIKDGSFKYGGGRSAGNRSLADNMTKKLLEP